MSFDYRRQQSIMPPSLNDLHLPTNPFNGMNPIPPAPIMEDQSHPPANDDILTQQEVFDVPNILTPWMLVGSEYAWKTSSDVGWLFSEEPNRTYPDLSPYSTPPHPSRQKRKLNMVMSFAQKNRSVAAHLQNLQWNPTSRKDTPKLRVNSDFWFSFKI